MKTRKVDVAIIGAGTAGLNARREAQRAGASWVLIDPGPLGTTCARVGCMPSKLLIAAAERAHQVRTAGELGLKIERWQVDGQAVLGRVRAERDRFVGGVLKTFEKMDDSELIRGRARFLNPTTLLVDDELRVEAKSIVIATGSRPWIPPQLDAIRSEVITSDEIFELERLPKSLAVFGTGAIGLELGQAFDLLGVEVEFFNPTDALGSFVDPEMKAVVRRVFDESLTLHMNADVRGVKKVADGYQISWTDEAGGSHQRTFERVMSAAGRRINIESLDLKKAEIPLDEHGRPPSDPRTLQCGDKPIFVAGDVSGHRPILHEASDEGRIAGENAARYPDVQATVRKTKLLIAFTTPQMVTVGQTLAELDPDSVVSGEVSFENQGRARTMAVNQGLVRLYGDKKTCRLVGAEMFGPQMEHMGHLLAWLIGGDETVLELLEKPVYHPVLEEGLRTGLRNLARNLQILGKCTAQTRADAPGD